MIRNYHTPAYLRVLYPSVVWKEQSENSIYLTFDDGPNEEVTPWVMEVLKKANAKATFFCLGQQLKACPELANALLTEGHELGNHTYSHLKGWETHNWEYQEDIRACDDELMGLGVHNQLFRPPYGRIRKSQISALRNRRIVMWSHLSWDFDPKLNIKKSLKKMKEVEPGSILVFHDSSKAKANLQSMLPELLDYYVQEGFTFDTL